MECLLPETPSDVLTSNPSDHVPFGSWRGSGSVADAVDEEVVASVALGLQKKRSPLLEGMVAIAKLVPPVTFAASSIFDLFTDSAHLENSPSIVNTPSPRARASNPPSTL
jgi:hypothetical protein